MIFAVFMSESQLLRLGGEVVPQQRLERPVWLVAATVGGALGVAATAVWLALGRGRSMLGRSRPVASVRGRSDPGQSAGVEGEL